jgi:AraC-like DNA-binding protein
MTARASSLTRRATVPPGATEGEWSMPSGDVRALMNAFGAVGYDAAALLGSAGVSPADASDPDARIPCESIGRIVCAAQQQRFLPNLGAELARVTPLGSYPLLDYLVMTSDTVGAGVRQLARYFRLIGSPIRIDPADDADPIRIQLSEQGDLGFGIEFTSTLVVLHLREETGGRFSAQSISVRHAPDDTGAWAHLLGCSVHPKAAWNGICVSRPCWELPLRRRDPVLRQILEARADDVLARLPRQPGLPLQVQRALSRRVAGGDTRMRTVARQLAMSGRTLQRRLAAEGVSYQQLRDDTRKEAAGRLLIESTLAIAEVAYLVGYSEPAPFHRAFRRWYGVTPEAFRNRQLRFRGR